MTQTPLSFYNARPGTAAADDILWERDRIHPWGNIYPFCSSQILAASFEIWVFFLYNYVFGSEEHDMLTQVRAKDDNEL